jgi:hypothetical protein
MYPPDGSPNSLPRLRLRSMYAEKPEDNLLFQVSVLVECCDGCVRCVCRSVVAVSDKRSPFPCAGLPSGPSCAIHCACVCIVDEAGTRCVCIVYHL